MWYESTRSYSKWPNFTQPYITDNYMWYYDGKFQFVDGEASWLENVSTNKLLERIEQYPDQYTEDLKYLVQKYKRYLVPIDEFREVFLKWGNQFNV